MKPAEASLPSDTEVLVKRSFDAPVKLVWRAYMEPDLMRRWCSGQPGWSMPVCEMDMRVGGQYRWRWRSDENGQEFGFTGEVLEVDPHAKIVHTQIFDPGDLGIAMGGEGIDRSRHLSGSRREYERVDHDHLCFKGRPRRGVRYRNDRWYGVELQTARRCAGRNITKLQ